MSRRGSLLLLTLIGLIFLADKSYPAKSTKGARKVRLKFDEDGYFKIIQLADLHYGHFPETDEHTDKVIANLLSYEQPDLAVLSGDMVSGFAWDGTNGWFEKRFRQLIKPIAAAGVPYALILGNHDDEADLSREQIVLLDMRLQQGSLTQLGPREAMGLSNYYLDIAANKGGGPAARIWMLDSGGRGCDWQYGGSGCVERPTIWWMNGTLVRLPRVPSLAFVHVPVPEFMEVWNRGAARGSKHEPVNCPMSDTGLFKALKSMGVTALHSGHDHDNNYEGLLDGVRLAYGHKTGYGSYGPPPGWGHGARVILLKAGQAAHEAETWIRLENGARVDQSKNPKFASALQTICEPGDGYCEEFPFAPTCRAELRFRLARLSHISLTTYLYSLGLLLAAAAMVMYRRRVVKRRGKQQEHSSL
ncbi:g3508 [Coccomyxa elongata]